MRSMVTKPIERKAARTFDVVTCGYNAVVIDSHTGHSITNSLSWIDASKIANNLNMAAAYGIKQLTEALGAL